MVQNFFGCGSWANSDLSSVNKMRDLAQERGSGSDHLDGHRVMAPLIICYFAHHAFTELGISICTQMHSNISGLLLFSLKQLV